MYIHLLNIVLTLIVVLSKYNYLYNVLIIKNKFTKMIEEHELMIDFSVSYKCIGNDNINDSMCINLHKVADREETRETV